MAYKSKEEELMYKELAEETLAQHNNILRLVRGHEILPTMFNDLNNLYFSLGGIGYVPGDMTEGVDLIEIKKTVDLFKQTKVIPSNEKLTKLLDEVNKVIIRISHARAKHAQIYLEKYGKPYLS